MEWSEEDKKLIDDVINSLCCYQNTLSDYQREIVGEEIRKLKSLRPQQKEDITKALSDKYNEGYKKGFKDAQESVSYHFPIMPTPSSGFGCDGTRCTNPQMDCINCPRKSTGGMFNTSSSSGEPTLKAEWKPTDVCYGIKGDPDPAGVWKPSEEQMKALQNAVALTACDKELTRLYNQLKKLM